jgi:hypothetical protein
MKLKHNTVISTHENTNKLSASSATKYKRNTNKQTIPPSYASIPLPLLSSHIDHARLPAKTHLDKQTLGQLASQWKQRKLVLSFEARNEVFGQEVLWYVRHCTVSAASNRCISIAFRSCRSSVALSKQADKLHGIMDFSLR